MIEKIEADLKQAMLARDQARVSVLRSLLNALHNASKDKKGELDEQEIIKVLNKEAKQRDEAAAGFTKGGAPERAEAEVAERAIIDQYLPESMDEEELSAIVDETLADMGKDPSNMGQIIGAVMGKTQGRADGATVAKVVKEKLAS